MGFVKAQIDSTSSELQREGAAARFPLLGKVLGIGTMDAQVKAWKLAVERLAADQTFDYRQAALLAGELARQSGEATLRQAALQAQPSLRAACAKGADRRTQEVAQRHFAAVRDVLHALTVPRFGKREDRTLTPEEQHRQLLGLPFGRRLFGPEINRAYKHAAKTVHPDVGGSNAAFLALAEARDALMKVL
jgi:hypothetical protein